MTGKKIEETEIELSFLLENVKNQIVNFDNKASILIGIISIAFSLTILSKDSIEKLPINQKNIF